MNQLKLFNRREFMALTGVSGGALILGANSAQTVSADVTVTHTPHDLGLFVTIDNTGDVQIICHRMEMGQGILTSTPQMVAEELCADWDRVTAKLGNANPAYGDQGTGGSQSIRSYITHTRQMGAVARQMLEQAAANQWNVKLDDVKAQDHFVTNKINGAKIGFGELASQASKLEVPAPESVSLKPNSEFTLIGKDVALQGLQDIVEGKAQYAQDVQIPGMLIASIERPPVVGGKTKSFDASEAKKVPGVIDVIRLKDRDYPVVVNPVSGVAVLATNTWAAIEGRKKLNIEWDHGDNQSHDSDAYRESLIKKVNSKAKQIRIEGDVYAHEFNASKTVEATYTVPYHHHMSMETPAATANVTDDGCEIWSGTQSPQWGKTLVLKELGYDSEADIDKVQFNTTLMGGAFGRKSKNDFTLEAVELSKAIGKPVKVIWSREDDVKHGFYHSSAANYFKAELTDVADKAGISTHQMWLNLFGKDRIFDPRKEGFEGYSLYGQESDEYLLDIARFKAVLNKVVDASGADESLPDGQGWGISVAHSFNSYTAAATKVRVAAGKVDVLEMHTAIDCGLVITPDRVVSQMEGAMIMGLSMALESEITVKDGAIVQNNFYDYPVSKINKVPPLHVHLMPSDKAPGGVGEPGLPPILPSITNAIFHASGKRIRDLPVKNTLNV